MAILVIGEREKAEIARAIARARKRPLPWTVGRKMYVTDRPVLKLADRRPGAPSREDHRPVQVLIPYGYRAMLSFEEQPAGMCMHLSISVERADPKWNPSVPAVAMIAAEFGIGLDRAQRDGTVWMEEYEPGRHAVNILVVTEPRQEGHA
jgi:hypothetical protein